MILSGESEILTDKGLFPLSHFDDKPVRVWNGIQFLEVRPKKITTEDTMNTFCFCCIYSYEEGRFIPFGTEVVGEGFKLKVENNLFIHACDIEAGRSIEDYSSNNGDRYRAIFLNSLKQSEGEIFEIKENIGLMVDSILVYN